MLHIRHILAPTDFSEHARRALRHACGLAVVHGARLDVLHILEEPTFPTFYALGASALYGEVPDLEAKADAALHDLIDTLDERPAAVKAYVRRGRPADEILTFAEQHQADLIVMASHGYSGLEQLLLGSVADKVVRTATCPVLVVKAFGKSLVDEPDASEAAASASSV